MYKGKQNIEWNITNLIFENSAFINPYPVTLKWSIKSPTVSVGGNHLRLQDEG